MPVTENAGHATKRHTPPKILRQSPKKHAQILIKRMKPDACRLPRQKVISKCETRHTLLLLLHRRFVKKKTQKSWQPEFPQHQHR